jgi:hypothetical protein
MSRAILITSIVAAAIIVILVVVDIYFAIDNIKGNTWSEILRFWGARIKIIPFAWGFLGGHFFHPAWPSLQQPMGIAVLVWLGVVVQIASMGINLPMLSYLCAGIMAGIFCWPV